MKAQSSHICIGDHVMYDVQQNQVQIFKSCGDSEPLLSFTFPCIPVFPRNRGEIARRIIHFAALFRGLEPDWVYNDEVHVVGGRFLANELTLFPLASGDRFLINPTFGVITPIKKLWDESVVLPTFSLENVPLMRADKLLRPVLEFSLMCSGAEPSRLKFSVGQDGPQYMFQ